MSYVPVGAYNKYVWVHLCPALEAMYKTSIRPAIGFCNHSERLGHRKGNEDICTHVIADPGGVQRGRDFPPFEPRFSVILFMVSDCVGGAEFYSMSFQSKSISIIRTG